MPFRSATSEDKTVVMRTLVPKQVSSFVDALKNSDLSEYLSLMGANPENRGQVFIKKLMAELLACHQFVLDHPFAEFNVKRSEYALSLEKMSPQDMAREAQRVKVDCPNISVFPSERAAVQAKLLDHFSKGHPNDMEAAELLSLIHI
eukprot:7247307-Pyramimonas_sp.AAC.1